MSVSRRKRRISYGRQSINQADIEAVVRTLQSDWITQGPAVLAFEKALARHCGARYAVAVSSGTAALHLACLALRLKANEEVVTSPLTFIATSNAILYAAAKPVFADVKRDTLNLDPDEVQKKVTGKTRAIIAVHFRGLPSDMRSIHAIAGRHGLHIIEDAAHALGAAYQVNGKWMQIGSCRHSDMTTFSFHPVKHITTGEGGAITTNRLELYKRLISLRSHGIEKDGRTRRRGPWFYEQRALGFNYRLTDFQCALGLSQLRRLPEFILRRRQIAERYDKAFSGNRFIRILNEPEGCFHSYHLYVVLVDFRKAGLRRARLMNVLKRNGIQTQVHYIPVHLQPYYRRHLGTRAGDFPNAERYYEETLSLPIYPALSDEQVDHVISSVLNAIGAKG